MTRSVDAEIARMSRTAVIWPWPPSIRIDVGPGREGVSSVDLVVAGSRLRRPASPCSLSSREKRRSITSRIMPKSSPGVISVERMLNLRYWFFTKPSGPATIMRADGIGAHDVGVVVDLDAPRRLVQTESFGEAGEQPRLGRGFRQPAAERLAGVLQAWSVRSFFSPRLGTATRDREAAGPPGRKEVFEPAPPPLSKVSASKSA